jgi:hypothetical protein
MRNALNTVTLGFSSAQCSEQNASVLLPSSQSVCERNRMERNGRLPSRVECNSKRRRVMSTEK